MCEARTREKKSKVIGAIGRSFLDIPCFDMR